MAIRGDSFSSVAEVTAYVRHLLDGQSAFNSTTLPTLTEVEKFIDRASGVLNTAISATGFAPSVIYANSTAKLPCDDWVTIRAAQMVELTKIATGWSEAEGSRLVNLGSLQQDAADFAKMMSQGWKFLGLTVQRPSHLGLAFTAIDASDQRSDPDNGDREQPKFTRGLFDNPDTNGDNDDNRNWGS